VSDQNAIFVVRPTVQNVWDVQQTDDDQDQEITEPPVGFSPPGGFLQTVCTFHCSGHLPNLCAVVRNAHVEIYGHDDSPVEKKARFDCGGN
jgi:hypothetical protein